MTHLHLYFFNFIYYLFQTSESDGTVADAGGLGHRRYDGVLSRGAVVQRIKGKRVRRISSSGHLGHEVKRVSVLRLSVQLRTGYSAFKHHGEQRVVDADLGLQKLSE